MNTNYGKSSNPQKGSAFDFDLGIGSSRPRSLNDQKQPQASSFTHSSSSFSSTQPKPATASSWQPNKPSWAHQPAPSQGLRPGLSSAPTSMVGDILGKSWTSAAPSNSTSGIGIVDKNPNLFGDLLGSALGSGKSNSNNTPLKSAAPVSNKSAYSMGNMTDSLPKTSNSAKNLGSSEGFGNFSSGYNNLNKTNSKSTNFGGPALWSMGGGGGGGGGSGSGVSVSKDPFGSLVDFTSKPAGSLNGMSKVNKTNTGDDGFGEFQNVSRSNTTSFSSNTFPASTNIFSVPSPVSDSYVDSFGIPTKDHTSQNQPTSGVDPLDMLFSTSSTTTGAAPAASEGNGGQQFSGVDDWGLDSEFGGNDGGGTTTELEGLPPPPAGVSASTAKNKGMDNYKQGQFADAVKWLSWAVILLEKAGDNAATVEVLSCRASCYKEVGEYKKAVADCTKVLEQDGTNVSVLVQRALLYESSEKYRLGAEDLRTVLRIDPANRLARSTIHRLTKMAD